MARVVHVLEQAWWAPVADVVAVVTSEMRSRRLASGRGAMAESFTPKSMTEQVARYEGE